MLKRLLLIYVFILHGFAYADIAPEAASQISSAKVKTAKSMMVVTANPYASQAAFEILQKGGNAIDAAIAAQWVLGLVEPQSSGIGGGAFLLYWQQDKQQLLHFDGRETAPAAVNSQHFMLADKPMNFFDALVGGHAVGVPGVLAMLEQAHQQQGKLPWAELFQPAITLAEQGFVVSERLHSLLLDVQKDTRTMQQKAFANYFYPQGEAVEVGQKLKNPAYAKTLKRVAKKGSKVFYQGKIAKHISQAVQKNTVRSGLLSRADLKAYQAKQNTALCHAIKHYQLCGSPPPSAGPLAVMQIVDLMEDILTEQENISLVDYYARYSEALALAMTDRQRYIGDPDYVEMPIAAMLGGTYLRPAAKAIKDGDKNYQTPLLMPKIKGKEVEQPSTTHLSIRDAEGNLVSMTSSIEMAFGSRIMVDGFLLNNQLTDFSFATEDVDGSLLANRIEPGKRPRSSMAPMIVFDKEGQPVMVLGSPGGARIISYVARVLVENLLLEKPLKDALESPHLSAFKKALHLENSASPSLIQGLQKHGYQVNTGAQTSGLHIIDLRHGKVMGIADGRREGQPLGD